MNPFRMNSKNFSRGFSCKFDTMQYFHRWSRLKQCYKMSIWNFFYLAAFTFIFQIFFTMLSTYVCCHFEGSFKVFFWWGHAFLPIENNCKIATSKKWLDNAAAVAIKNPTIYNIIRWFTDSPGRMTRRPSIWCSKHYFFHNFL